MKLIECPRDAMQGLAHFVPTDLKIRYLNALLKVGFDTLDFGSFVSAKAVPQLRDTAEVLAGLDLSQSSTKLLAIVANLRGAGQAVGYSEVTYVGFPLSVSETFQLRNTNKTTAQALGEVAQMQDLCLKTDKTLVVYLSMGFGNPYADGYSPELVGEFTEKLVALGIGTIAPSDTVGTATPAGIEALFTHLIGAFPRVEFGAHLHALPGEAPAKVGAALRAGVTRFDSALRGFGGCPMADDHLTGNVPTEAIIDLIGSRLTLDETALAEAMRISNEVFL